MNTKVAILCGFALCLSLFAAAQEDENQKKRTLIEDAIEQLEGEEDFDFDTQFELFEGYLRRPLNLNAANIRTLQAFGLLNPLQIESLLNYRKENGDLLDVYELQAIPNFDVATIDAITPYVSIGSGLLGKADLKTRLSKGEHAVYTRFRRVLEQQDGYADDRENGYLGNKNQHYFRYRYNYDTRLSYGVTLEKDAGEEFFRGSNARGFDYTSAHLYLREVSKNIDAVAIGDFQANFGQGLALWSGFGFGKGAFVMNTKRQALPLRAYTSVNENAFLRGIGTTLTFGKTEITAFVSYKPLDATTVEQDSIDLETETAEVSAFQLSGFHRTASEIANKNSVQQFMTGANLKRYFSRGSVGLSGVFAQYDAVVAPTDAPYNLYRFNAKSLANWSADYEYTYKNLHFFGETAMSDNLGIATLNSLLITAHRFVDVVVLQRHFEPDFQTVAGNAFAESQGVRNESGVYVGLSVQPNRRWRFVSYFDNWRHQWLRFGIDAPSVGSEFLTQLTYRPNRETEMYVRYRSETKERNATNSEAAINVLVPQTRQQLRFDFRSQLNESFSIRSRVEIARFQSGSNATETGFLLYQDVTYRADKFRCSARFALFDTETYNARIYAYENDLLYNFSVPAYYYKGSRFYLNASYRFSRAFMVEARLARTRFYDRETVGSGLELIDGDARTEVKVQARLRF